MKYTRHTSVVVFLFVISTSPAYAYLDPSTGSMILQIILGGLAGLAVGAKLFWHRITMLFSFGKRKEKEKENEE